MAVVMGAMGNLAPKLLQLLNEEYKLQKGLRKKVEFVRRELESIEAALGKVAAVPWDQLDEQVKVWARQVREASYEMEDVLDTFLLRVEGCEPAKRSRLKRALKKMGGLFGKVKARRDIDGAIEDIKKELQEVANRHANYKIDEIVAKPAPRVDPRLSALYTKASRLVGVDEPRDTLIEMLSIGADNTSSKEMKIISIVGFGGLGKTTLAKAVFDKVNPQFDCGAFIPVGQNPDPRKILRDILIDLINDIEKRKTINDIEKRKTIIGDEKRRYNGADLIGLDERQLINELCNFLEGKRYFIVIDDIWDTSIWGIITNAFVESNCGSRIIATSRVVQVSQKIYRIKKLSDSNSRILLFTRIFGGEDKWPDNDEVADVAHKILHKCHGVPLAIVTIASLLASKQIDEWSNVYNSIGFAHGDNTQVKDMKKILSFSYYDLPCHLRTCMLYLSAYPEDFLVHKEELMWRWIADDLVHTKGGKTLFELADSYLNEIINRGMVLPVEREGIMIGCRVHDMVLHMIRDLSREENFFSVEDSDEQGSQGNVRRLALHRARLKHNQASDMGMPKVRSFNAISCRTNMVPPVSGFQFLRVLALEYCHTEEGYHHLEHIGKLLHLRYLGLTHTPTHELPKEIGNLKCLQTLMLYGTGIEELPRSLGQLTELMCLYADEKTRVPDWIGKLTSLVELMMCPTLEDKFFVKELGKLRELRDLTIQIDVQDEGHARDLLESLSNLEKIENIRVEMSQELFYLKQDMAPSLVLCCNLRRLRLDAICFSRLPESINPQALPNLQSLSLKLSQLNQHDMEIIGWFKKLSFLELYVTTLLSIISICSGDGFQNLKSLNAHFYPLKFGQGAMPCLENLELTIHVSQVKDDKFSLDFGLLGNLTSLQRVTAEILCYLCSLTEVEEVEAELRHAVDIHPNRPTLEINRRNKDKMVNDPDSQMLKRQNFRRERLRRRVQDQRRLIHEDMRREALEMGELKTDLNTSDANNKVQRFVEQINAVVVGVNQALLPFQVSTDNRDLNKVMEDNAALEQALVILNVQYPRFVLMLEELRIAFGVQGTMPRLEVINLNICARDVKVDNLSLDFGLGNHSFLQGVKAHIDCYMCFPTEVEEVEAELRHAVDIHPNRPTLEIIKYLEDEMVNSHSQLLKRQILRALILRGRVINQMELYHAICREAAEMSELEHHLNLSGENNKVQSFLEQCGAIADLVEGNDLLLQYIPIDDGDLDRVTEAIAAFEQLLEILTVECPRLNAMLEELRTEFSLQAEDDGTDKVASDTTTDKKVGEEEVSAPSVPNQ
ncbi:unnamed protein product [Urochloa decumbens]|uniref:Uncharacterized protein n=1 Tax=Urochloa decumbens TaxID=240449 RepID=A0ABC9G9P7_9POAL